MSSPETPASSVVSLMAVCFSFSFCATLPFGKTNLSLQRRDDTTHSSNSLPLHLIGMVPALASFLALWLGLLSFIFGGNFLIPRLFFLLLCFAGLFCNFAMPHLTFNKVDF